MSTYNKQQQAVILKGIAQQLLSMSVPDFFQLNKLLNEFGYSMEKPEELRKMKDELKACKNILMLIHLNKSFSLDMLHGGSVHGKIDTMVNLLKDFDQPITYPELVKIFNNTIGDNSKS